MNPGETLLEFDFERHLWVVLSIAVEGRIAVVNFTTHRPSHIGDTCLVEVGEHPFVRHQTCVYYRGAHLTPVEPLRIARGRGLLRQHEPLSASLLRRVQEGALASRYTSKSVLAAVRATLGATQ